MHTKQTFRAGIYRLIPSVFFCLLITFLLAACGSEPASQAVSPTSTPKATPTSPPPTPTPAPPDVSRKDVTFMTKDNIKIFGMLYGEGSTTAMICAHQSDGTWLDWRGVAPWFVQRGGFMVLSYDTRGYGKSEGNRDSSAFYQDMLGAIDFLKSLGVQKIILAGASQGGRIALATAAKTEVAGIITLSSPYDDRLISKEEFAAIKAPKLFVNTEFDNYAGDTQQMYNDAAEPKELVIYKGDRTHGVGIFSTDKKQDLIDRMLAFVKKNAP